MILRRTAKRELPGGFRVRPDCAYIAFNKPYGVLTQFTWPAGSDKQTLSGFGFPPRVYPLGRLDYDSEGLLLLADDPRLNRLLLDPAFRHERTYLVQVEHIPDRSRLKQLEEGIRIGGARTLPARVELLDAEPELPDRPVPVRFRKTVPTAWLRLTLREGRNRQVRRMTAAIGCPTLRLVRTTIGQLSLASLNLAPGQWMELNPDQVLAALARRAWPAL